MLAKTPKTGHDDDADGPEVFWPLLGLAVLTAGWSAFCWWLKGHVADHGVVKGITIMAWFSGGSTVLWLVLAWVMRPRKP